MMKTKTFAAALSITAVLSSVGAVSASAATTAPATNPTSTKTSTTSTKTTTSKKVVNSNPHKLDSRCLRGRVVCINKTTRKMYWVVDGKVKRVMNTRLGRKGMETKEGVHKIYWKHKNHRSSAYNNAPMPYSQFFYKGQAIHQNSDWAKKGYGVGSHGCANLKTLEEAAWLWKQTRVGDKVVVYRGK